MSDLAAIVDDLARLVDQARWAEAHGYWKDGHGLDAERGMDLSKTDAERMAGPLYDLQIGNHKARVAYQRAVLAVARSDVLLASLVETAQPPIVKLTPYSRTPDLVLAAKNATWRAHHVTVNDHARTTAVRSSLDRAVRGLSKALEAGPELKVDQGADKGIPTGLRCRICGWRKFNPKLGGRCGTCWKWLQRKGEERPAHLDGITPQEAQRKRLERDEGWGAA